MDERCEECDDTGTVTYSGYTDIYEIPCPVCQNTRQPDIETEPKTVGDDEAYHAFISDAVKRGLSATPKMAWNAAKSHERATVREAEEIMSIMSSLLSARAHCVTDEDVNDWEDDKSEINQRFNQSFPAAHKPEKETGWKFCEWVFDYEDDERKYYTACNGFNRVIPDNGICPINGCGKPIRIKDGSNDGGR